MRRLDQRDAGRASWEAVLDALCTLDAAQAIQVRGEDEGRFLHGLVETHPILSMTTTGAVSVAGQLRCLRGLKRLLQNPDSYVDPTKSLKENRAVVRLLVERGGASTRRTSMD